MCPSGRLGQNRPSSASCDRFGFASSASRGRSVPSGCVRVTVGCRAGSFTSGVRCLGLLFRALVEKRRRRRERRADGRRTANAVAMKGLEYLGTSTSMWTSLLAAVTLTSVGDARMAPFCRRRDSVAGRLQGGACWHICSPALPGQPNGGHPPLGGPCHCQCHSEGPLSRYLVGTLARCHGGFTGPCSCQCTCGRWAPVS